MSCRIHRRVSRCLTASAPFIVLAGVIAGAAAQEAPAQEERVHARAGEETVLAALAAATEVDFEETPLSEAIAFLEERHGIEIEVDAVAVEEAGATIDSPASLAVRGISLRSALNYYESVGRNWERAAMIKARPCAGDEPTGEALLNELVPFIWRKYLDFAAITDVQAMKQQIHAYKGHGEIAIEGHNLKLGRGGIR